MNRLLYSVLRILPDNAYISLKYLYHFGKLPNLKQPKTFNEKLQWLKLYDRRPLYEIIVDKYEAKKYISNIIGEQYVIPCYGVWDKFEDINFEILPKQFVLKTTHDCGGVYICKDKASFDKEAARRFLEKHLKANYFLEGREWPYKNVKPRILAEAYMENLKTHDLRDYKFFAFDGKTKLLFVATDRQKEQEEVKFDFYDIEFNHLPIKNGHPNSSGSIQKPESFEEMVRIADKLSEGIPHVRVDFYEVNGRPYVGELTLSHFSGIVPFEPEEWDRRMGDWIVLPAKTRIKA